MYRQSSISQANFQATFFTFPLFPRKNIHSTDFPKQNLHHNENLTNFRRAFSSQCKLRPKIRFLNFPHNPIHIFQLIKPIQSFTISFINSKAISHQFAYIGAPKTLNGVAALQKSLEVRKAQGIRDPQGKSATDLGNADYYALGTQTLAELSQALTSRPIFDFAPALDYTIKAQLFGYQFARGNLAAPEWELVTLASLAAQGKAVNGQLRSHLWVLKNLGTGDEQMAQIFATLENVAGKEVADNARAVWAEVK